MAKRSTYGRQQHSPTTRHQHDDGKSRCLNILRKLSAYIDDELSGSICREIRRHLGACPNCETFVVSLRQIVSLCRRSQVPALSTAERAFMRRKILQTAQTR